MENENEINYSANNQLETDINNSFFYTNDNMIIKSLVHILNDEAFIEEILDQYNLTTYDFFKIIFRKFCLTFKALQIKKLKAVVQNKSYVNKFRPKYNY